MGMVVTSLVINFILMIFSMAQFLDDPDAKYFAMAIFIALMIFWLMSLTGSLMYHKTKKNSFGIIAIIGFAVYVPIGLIGAIGIRKLMDEEKRNAILLKNEKTHE